MNHQANELEALMNEQLRRWRAVGAAIGDGGAAENGEGFGVAGPPPDEDGDAEMGDANANAPHHNDNDNNNNNDGSDIANANASADAEANDGDQQPIADGMNFENGLDLMLGRLEDGAYEGGVAGALDDKESGNEPAEKSTSCDLTLYIECEEELEIAPNHPLFRPGVTVAIGLARSTKLGAVFAQYVNFCNKNAKNQPHVSLDKLEFTFCQLLDPTHTAEASALMKNDKIKAKGARSDHRNAEAERKRQQRDADKEYFKQLKQLMPDLGGARMADIILDCRGKLVDENGRNQQVLCTTVKAHSSILRKRCKWFGDIIDKARQERDELRRQAQQSNPAGAGNQPQVTLVDQNLQLYLMQQHGSHEVNLSHHQHQHPNGHNLRPQQEQPRQQVIGEEPEDDSNIVNNDNNDNNIAAAHRVGEDGIAALDFQPQNARAHSGATAIENDYDDESSSQGLHTSSDDEASMRSGSPVPFSHHTHTVQDNFLWVTISNHSPEAVKLMLEYCYSNRVGPLGHEAFAAACKTKPLKHSGPIPPFAAGQSSSSRRWPNNRFPTVSFSVILDAISLAEEASMGRFSLMCEVAASQLVSTQNVVEALTMCTYQEKSTGNSLPRLRKAAMDRVLRHGSLGVGEVSAPLTRVLKEQSAHLLPTLLRGMSEALTKENLSKADKLERRTLDEFCTIDEKDVLARQAERKRRRTGKSQVQQYLADHGVDESVWKIIPADTKMKVKRVAGTSRSTKGGHGSWHNRGSSKRHHRSSRKSGK